MFCPSCLDTSPRSCNALNTALRHSLSSPRCNLPSLGADSAPSGLCLPFHTLWVPEGTPPVAQHPPNCTSSALGDEGEGQVGSVSGEQEVISLKDLGEFFLPSPKCSLPRTIQRLAAELRMHTLGRTKEEAETNGWGVSGFPGAGGGIHGRAVLGLTLGMSLSPDGKVKRGNRP